MAGRKTEAENSPENSTAHRVASSEELDHYIKVTNPSAWIVTLAALLLVGGVTDLVTSAYVAISRHRSWILTVLLSVASIGLGIAAISNPFDTQNKLLQVLGAGLLVFALVDLISYIQIKVIAKQVQKSLDEEAAAQTATEVEFTDVTADENTATEVDYVEVDEN